LCVDADSLRRDVDIWRVPGKVWLKAKLALVALTAHPWERGADETPARLLEVGNVGYKKAPELGGGNLDVHRGKTRGQFNPRAIQNKPPHPNPARLFHYPGPKAKLPSGFPEGSFL
jgi:hypothetical protein